MKLCTYHVMKCSECKALYHVSEVPGEQTQGKIGFICSILGESVENVNAIDGLCPLPDENGPGYRLSPQDCKNCRYTEKDRYELDYNGEPRTTFKEACSLVLIIVAIILLFILIGYLGGLQ